MTAHSSRDWASRLVFGLAVFAVVNLVAVIVAYALYPGYLEHGEAASSATAFRLLRGFPAYYPFDAAERISNVYGPWTYLWQTWAMVLFGASLTTSKIAGLLGSILVVVGAWALGRRHGRLGEALAVALAAGFILFHLGFPITIRPDSLLSALVTVAVLAAARAEARSDMAWAETLVIGIAGGIAVNVKIHAGLYMAPAALLHLSGNWRRLFPMAASGALALAAPFLSPLFPLSDYLSWFGPMSGKENSWNGFRVLWMKFAFYLGTPLLVWGLAGFSALRGRQRLYLATYVGCGLLVLFPATKVGGSHHYYLPLLPVLIDLSLRALAVAGERLIVRRALAIVAVLLLFMAAQTERRFFKTLEWKDAREVSAEIDSVIRANPGVPIQMGVGGPRTEEKFYLYSWRNLLVFAGGPYTLDTAIVMEMTKLGVAMPAETIRRMAACETRLWLIPHGEAPFSLIGYYNQTIYNDAFRQAFADHHRLDSSGTYFDLWRCTE
ncbi:MAG: glycosyltransferase family 39 protein [Phaeospirillum sp.]|nr:glycosyltransferase family 39 protein [Phaeospirillum sp.]